MTEFDKKLNNKLHHYKAETGKTFYQISKEVGIPANRVYRFTSGERGLNGEDTKKMLGYLGLTVELRPKNYQHD